MEQDPDPPKDGQDNKTLLTRNGVPVKFYIHECGDQKAKNSLGEEIVKLGGVVVDKEASNVISLVAVDTKAAAVANVQQALYKRSYIHDCNAKGQMLPIDGYKLRDKPSALKPGKIDRRVFHEKKVVHIVQRRMKCFCSHCWSESLASYHKFIIEYEFSYHKFIIEYEFSYHKFIIECEFSL